MNIFLKILRVFFVILGVIFFLIIVAGFYLYQSDFYGIKTIVNYGKEEIVSPENSNNINSNEVVDKNPILNSEQELQLESIGINPANLPTEINPEMEKCFIQKLGKMRVEEIEAGVAPTTSELLKAKSCLN
jgi:hypothetical protein